MMMIFKNNKNLSKCYKKACEIAGQNKILDAAAVGMTK